MSSDMRALFARFRLYSLKDKYTTLRGFAKLRCRIQIIRAEAEVYRLKNR